MCKVFISLVVWNQPVEIHKLIRLCWFDRHVQWQIYTVLNLSVSCCNLNIKSQDDIFRSVFYPLLFQIVFYEVLQLGILQYSYCNNIII